MHVLFPGERSDAVFGDQYPDCETRAAQTVLANPSYRPVGPEYLRGTRGRIPGMHEPDWLGRYISGWVPTEARTLARYVPCPRPPSPIPIPVEIWCSPASSKVARHKPHAQRK